MNEYLIQILKVENTVIIPGLGALMVTNSKTGAVMFNPHLKFNDKTLEKYVEENSNMDAQEASNFVAKFSNEIISQLDKGESYDIFGLGKFVKNGDEIEFIQNAEGTQTTPPKKDLKKAAVTAPVKEEEENPKIEDSKGEQQKETKEEKKVESKPTPVPTPVVSNESKIEPEVKKDSPKNSYTEPKKEKVPEKKPVKEKATPADTKAALTSEEKVKKTEELKKAGVKPTKTMEKTKKDKKPKKNKGLKIFLLLLLLLLIGGGVYIGMFWKDRYQYVFGFAEKEQLAENHKAQDSKEKNPDQITDNSEADNSETIEENNSSDSTNLEENVASDLGNETEEEVAINNEETEEEVIEEPVKIVESSTSFESNGSRGGNGDYHVVVGLFQNPSNADGLVSKLKGEGHAATILGTFDGLQMVVVKSFPSREAAIDAMREIRSTIEDRAWVFRY